MFWLNKRQKRWYADKQNLALVTGAISSVITLVNFWLTTSV